MSSRSVVNCCTFLANCVTIFAAQCFTAKDLTDHDPSRPSVYTSLKKMLVLPIYLYFCSRAVIWTVAVLLFSESRPGSNSIFPVLLTSIS